MFKHFTIALLGVAGLLVLAGSAQAAVRRGCCCHTDCGCTVAVAAPAQPAPTTPATVQAQSERQTVRSYSYEPATPSYVPYNRPYRTHGGDPGNNFNAGRKISGL